MSFDASVHAKAVELTRLAIDMTAEAGSGHPTSAASLAHVATVLLYNHMRYDPAEPGKRTADRLVLSEGHACPIIYAAGADLGFAIGSHPERNRRMTAEDARSLREISSEIDGHPNPAEGFPFFPAATGSLGQGLSIAAGLALAARLDSSDSRIFAIIGDGESREGQIWEAIDFIVDYDLRAVCPIFNCNGYGQSDAVSERQSPQALGRKLEAAGFATATVDGHDPTQIQLALTDHAALSRNPGAKPLAVIARTTKAWGFPSAQGGGLHGKPLTDDDREKAFRELDETAAVLGAAWTEGSLRIPDIPPSPAPPSEPEEKPMTFDEALRAFGKESVLEEKKLATRKAYGLALRALGRARRDVVALDGDVRNSTYSEYFLDDPELESRFFECRIAEQNMASCAAGLAAGGKLPFMSSFGKFILRACDQIEMAIISGLDFKIVGSHAGVSLAADGPSQMALPDVAFFRAFATARDGDRPLLYVLQPADARAAYALTLAMAEHDGPCYLRTLRPDVPFLYDEETTFRLGGYRRLTEGRDVLIAASGYMVHEAKRALEGLREKGVDATLVDLYSLPFDEGAFAELAEECGGRVLTVEDNYGGGIGSAVAELGARQGRFVTRSLQVRKIPKSGRTPDDVLRYLSLSRDDIAESCLSLLDSVRL